MTDDMTDEQLKFKILNNFDFAFKIDWTREEHRRVHRYLAALTMFIGIRFNGHIASAGNFLAYRFDNRNDVEKKVQTFRNLFKNESSTFIEERCGGCCIFTF